MKNYTMREVKNECSENIINAKINHKYDQRQEWTSEIIFNPNKFH